MKVTDYMIKKWVQAVFLIMAAIVLVIFGLQFFNSLPSEATLFQFYWFLFALFWFVVIVFFTYAIVKIIQGFVTRTSKMTIGDISLKLDELEGVIKSGAIYAIPAGSEIEGSSGENVPPPPTEEKKLSKKKIAVVIVAVILIIAAIAIALMMFVFNTPGSGGATPEQVFDQFINRMIAKDASGVVDQTIFKFASNRSDLEDALQQNMFSQMIAFNINVNQRTAINKQDLSQDDRNEITSLIDDLEQDLGIDIVDFCVIEFRITVQTPEGTMYWNDTIPVFLVDDIWYLMMPDFGGNGGPNGSSPESVFNSFIDQMNAHNAYGALNLSISRFSPDFAQIVSEFDSMMFSGTFSISISNYWIKDPADFNQSETDMMNQTTDMINQKYSKSVSEFRFVYYTGTQTNNSGTFSVSNSMPAVLIDNEWYLVVLDESNMGPDIVVNATPSSESGNWNISINSIMGTSSLSYGEVYLTVNYSDGSNAIFRRSLNTWTPGVMADGVTFFDTTNPGTLDVGDYFILDGGIYAPSSDFMMTNIDGADIYCVIDVV